MYVGLLQVPGLLKVLSLLKVPGLFEVLEIL